MKHAIRVAALSTAALAGFGALTTTMLAGPTAGLASSHREAPGITETPKLDGTDFYMFRSYEPGRDQFVTLIANYQPLQAAYGGPNYFTMDPEAVYEIHIDNTGDAVEDITFQFRFDNTLRSGTGITLNVAGQVTPIALRAAGAIAAIDDANQGEQEFFTLKHVAGDRRSGTANDVTNAAGGATVFAKPIDNIGQKTVANYATYAGQFVYDVVIPGCPVNGRVFVGQREEAFAVNLGPIFDLVNLVPVEGDSAPGAGDGGGFAGGITQSRNNEDLVDEFNVTTLAIEAPISCLTGSGNGVIGAWTTSSLPQAQIEDPSPTYESPSVFGGALVQQSRLSAPLVNELFIGLDSKDAFNASEPVSDTTALISGGLSVAQYASNPTFPEILELLFGAAGVQAPNNFPRADLVAAFATGFAGVNQLATVTPAEMVRLNTAIAPTVQASQSTFGVAGGDLAGFPNGRRPGDDAIDIALRVAMGRLCHPIPVNGVDTNLGLCAPADAPSGLIAFTDGAPVSASTPANGATELQNAFPYLNTPIPGSPRSAR